ncbi:uncharacterized protein DS421_6g173410 [Arachis hypogaea]|nr:uncharacterized protein DS421_6g173410 [Arachis hypogaea]
MTFYSPWSTIIRSSGFLWTFEVQDKGVWSCIYDPQTLRISPYIENRFVHCDRI